MKLIVVALVLAAVAGTVLYIRVMPSDPAFWHRMPGAVTERNLKGGAMRLVGAGDDGLARLEAIVLATPRTKRLAGSVADGMVTYVTRSALFGFPDYTTIRQAERQIEIYGRLRFGRSDFGVNAARIDRWLGALAQ